MSERLELYRTTVNLRGLGSGTLIEIDPDEPRWAADIRTRRIVPTDPPEGAYAVVTDWSIAEVVPVDSPSVVGLVDPYADESPEDLWGGGGDWEQRPS